MDINTLYERMDNIDAKLNDIDTKLIDIFKLLDEQVKPNCSRMNEHINFVEVIYNNVKHPLGFLCNKLNFYSSNKTYNIENIENK
jgi:hypothetical protein